MQIVKVDPAKFGLEENKAQQISDQFKPMLDKMVELEKEANEIYAMDLTPEKCADAKELRLKYVKVRTGTAEIHKQQKAFYLAGGRYVDGWKSAQLFASQDVEEKLLNIEKHFENAEKERKDNLRNDRLAELEKCEVDGTLQMLGEMTEDVWVNYLAGVQLQFKARKDAEAEAEKQRIEAEKAEELRRIEYEKEQVEIRKENERLKKEAEAKEAQRQAEENARIEKENKDRIEREAADRQREKVAMEAQRKERDEHEAKIKKEREQREKVEAELKAKADEAARIEAEKETQRQAELSKGDAAKIKDLVNDLEQLKTKYQFKSNKNQTIYGQVGQLLAKVVSHIKQ